MNPTLIIEKLHDAFVQKEVPSNEELDMVCNGSKIGSCLSMIPFILTVDSQTPGNPVWLVHEGEKICGVYNATFTSIDYRFVPA